MGGRARLFPAAGRSFPGRPSDLEVVYSEKHRGHAPPFEFAADGMYPYSEAPGRAEAIRSALAADLRFRFAEPEEFDPGLLAGIHDPGYLGFLDEIYPRWVEAGRPAAGVIPDSFALYRQATRPRDLLAQPGYYCFDAQTPVAAGTRDAAYASAGCALTGARLLLRGERSAYALCRPPGHHASRSGYGGYCYLNNAAAAASLLAGNSGEPLAILDIDYHHGNGTQEIFYESEAVATASLHADPNRAYPFFWGYPGETGAGPGSGRNRNFPLPAGIGDRRYRDELRRALDYLDRFSASRLVVSLGVDTSALDPLGDFELTLDGFAAVGKTLADYGKPVLFVQEGGYDTATMGEAVRVLLSSFEGGSRPVGKGGRG